MAGKLSCGLIILILCGVAAAQSGTKTEPASNVEPVSGKQLYGSYCALCHGSDGKGGGPFATQLKVWPPDLTQLAKKNNGVFPEMHVEEAIDGEFSKAAHGTKEMPIWGPVFRSMAHGRKDSARIRLEALVKYLESIQDK
jgi:mono/diheme cytochrome c family protein